MNLSTFSSRVRDKYLQTVVDHIKLPYIKLLHPDRKAWDVSMDSLKTCEDSTLGARLYQFLTSNNLELQSLYESHDIYHIISGYGIGMKNEAKLFFFLFGNGKKSISVMGSIAVALVCYPRQWKEFYLDYKRGKTMRAIHQMEFEDLLDCDFEEMVESLQLG